MENIKTLLCDIETYSSENLAKCGTYRYSEANDFEILLFGYSVNESEINVVDLACGEKIPEKIIKAIKDPDVIKYTHNSSFERICMSRHLNLPQGEYLDPQSWRCTMTWAAYMGLPLSLEGVGAVLRLDKQKLTEGKDLIKYFCQSCTPTKSNGGRIRNYSYHDAEKWERFKEYNKRDVVAELAIKKRLEKFPVPEYVWDEYHLSENINDRGVALDMTLVKEAIKMDGRSRSELTEVMKKLTELENPNSVVQMKEWLADNGLETDSLGKKAVAELLKTAPSELQDVLSLKQQLAKSSVKKYQAMQNCVCADGRARGMYLFYGASRTGRFSSKMVQLQNLPQNHLQDLSQARNLVCAGNYEALEILYDSVPSVLSELIRTAFVPKPGFKFIVADFASIERVILAWIADEKWVLDAFNKKKDLYIATASRMFRVPVEQVDKKSLLRQKGKIADLACVAEGQLVLTNRGLVPIESITIADQLWDGEEWVAHDGVVFRGEQKTVCLDGVICTPDHFILTSEGWIEGGKSSGFNWAEVRLPNRIISNGEQPSRKGNVGVPLRLWFRKGLRILQSITREHKVLRLLYVGNADGTRLYREKRFFGHAAFLPGLGGYEEPVLFTRKPLLAFVWRARDNSLRKMVEFRKIQERYVGIIRTGCGIRSHRRKRELLAGQLPLGYGEAEQSKSAQRKTLRYSLGLSMHFGDSEKGRLLESLHTHSTTDRRNRREIMAPSQAGYKRVYDLLNCGKRHRFAVWNGFQLCLVHNCGYGGSVGALKAMGALDMGITEEELLPMVKAWRAANPKIVRLWWDVDKATMSAVRERTITQTHGIRFSYQSGILFITLPSDRRLAYVKPRIEANRFGNDSITYEGVGQTKKWERIESFGAKLVENIVQSISRDILCHAMRRLDEAGLPIVMHVHDEVVIESPTEVSPDSVIRIMEEAPPWAKGLPLRADGFSCSFYKKD